MILQCLVYCSPEGAVRAVSIFRCILLLCLCKGGYLTFPHTELHNMWPWLAWKYLVLVIISVISALIELHSCMHCRLICNSKAIYPPSIYRIKFNFSLLFVCFFPQETIWCISQRGKCLLWPQSEGSCIDHSPTLFYPQYWISHVYFCFMFIFLLFPGGKANCFFGQLFNGLGLKSWKEPHTWLFLRRDNSSIHATFYGKW